MSKSSFRGGRMSVSKQLLVMARRRIKGRLHEVEMEKDLVQQTVESYFLKKTELARSLLEDDHEQNIAGSAAFQKANEDLEKCFGNLFKIMLLLQRLLEDSDVDNNNDDDVDEDDDDNDELPTEELGSNPEVLFGLQSSYSHERSNSEMSSFPGTTHGSSISKNPSEVVDLSNSTYLATLKDPQFIHTQSPGPSHLEAKPVLASDPSQTEAKIVHPSMQFLTNLGTLSGSSQSCFSSGLSSSSSQNQLPLTSGLQPVSLQVSHTSINGYPNSTKHNTLPLVINETRSKEYSKNSNSMMSSYTVLPSSSLPSMLPTNGTQNCYQWNPEPVIANLVKAQYRVESDNIKYSKPSQLLDPQVELTPVKSIDTTKTHPAPVFQPVQSTLHVPPITVGSRCIALENRYIVKPLFISSPSDFFVKITDEETVANENMLRNKLCSIEKTPCSLKPVCMGIYLCKDCKSQLWLRVRVLEVQLQDPSPHCLVFYIDYGAVQPVPIDSLALISLDLAAIPPLAFHCCLHRTKPKESQGDSWCSTALQSFLDLMKNYQKIGLIGIFKNKNKSQASFLDYQYALDLHFHHCEDDVPIYEYLLEVELKAKQEIPTTSVQEVVKQDCIQSVQCQSSKPPPTLVWNIKAPEFQSTKFISLASATPTLPSTVVKESEKPVLSEPVEAYFTSPCVPSEPVEPTLTPPCVPKIDTAVATTDKTVLEDGSITVCSHPFLNEWPTELITCLISVIENPSDFYVHVHSESTDKYDELQEKIHDYYKDKEPYHHNPCQVFVGSWWACQFPDDHLWYRVVVHKIVEHNTGARPKKKTDCDVLTPDTRVVVQFVDWGNTIETLVSGLQPLTPKFCRNHYFALPCALAHVYPVDGEMFWSSQVTQRMKELVGTDQVVTLCIKNKLQNGRLAVSLWVEEDLNLNELLVQEGLAKQHKVKDDSQSVNPEDQITGNCSLINGQKNQFNAAYQILPEEEKSLMDTWDPMGEEYSSVRNSYSVDVDDPELATTGYKSRDGQQICSFFDMGKLCPRGNVCPFKHLRNNGGTTLDRKEDIGMLPSLDLPPAGTYLYASVSAIFNPSHFYLIFPYGCQNFRDTSEKDLEDQDSLGRLSKEMTKLYNRSSSFQEDRTETPPIGTFVAARSTLEDKWLRAQILHANKDGTKFDVFFVDFGTEERVNLKHICKLHQQFAHLPKQAVECVMDIAPLEKNKWCKESQKYLEKLVKGQTILAKLESENHFGKWKVKLFFHLKNKTIDIGREMVKLNLASRLLNTEDEADNVDIYFMPG